jgi:hypothetical protein
LVLGFGHLSWDGFADFFKAWKVPAIGKVMTLRGLDGLNRTVPPLDEDAFAVGFFLQGKPSTILTKARVALDEIELG